MEKKLSPARIRQLAGLLDAAIEKQNIKEIMSHFSADCQIEMLGVRLSGKEGLRREIAWMYRYLEGITLVPVTIMVEDDTFFEEFIVKAHTSGGREIQVKQAEVLIYDDEYRVKSLRLYFDRLELAAAFVSGPVEKLMVGQLTRASLKGPVQ
jgi:hypothetical protein